MATEEIKIPLGQLGDIELSVCNSCKPKFDMQAEKNNTLNQVSRRDQSTAYLRTIPRQEPHLNDDRV